MHFAHDKENELILPLTSNDMLSLSAAALFLTQPKGRELFGANHGAVLVCLRESVDRAHAAERFLRRLGVWSPLQPGRDVSVRTWMHLYASLGQHCVLCSHARTSAWQWSMPWVRAHSNCGGTEEHDCHNRTRTRPSPQSPALPLRQSADIHV